MAAPAADRPTLFLVDEQATARLAEDIAAVLQPGDLVALSGGLGAGKTTFARALLRAIAGDPQLEAPSPTFPLRIDHALPRLRVTHADLYRLGDGSELDEIGLDEALMEGAVVVEWPERLPAGYAENRLDLRLELKDAGRSAELTASGSWPPRLTRTGHIRDFLNASGFTAATRTPISGDASYRAYERITHASATTVLMNAPAKSEGPPVHDGRSYDDLAHRARDVRAFVAIGTELRRAGVRTPEILATDLDSGLLILEDLGGEGIVDAAGAPIMQRYQAAIDLLVFMHGRRWPDEAPLPGGGIFRLPPYDRGALLIEISLFPDWFGGYGGEPAFPKEERDGFLAAWSRVLDRLEASDTTWVMRDFHSPNILWQPAARELDQVGVIDFQDALIGHPAYDLASLAQDARVSLTEGEERSLRDRYLAGRAAQGGAIDAAEFNDAYAVLGLQRATKVLGIFTRLALAEGKPGYRRHRARLKELIRRNLAHPVLSELRVWYEPYL